MLKKIKRIYYRKRDRGKGKQFIVTLCLIGFVILASTGYGVMAAMEYLSSSETAETKEAEKDSLKPETENIEQTDVPEEMDIEEEPDLSGMDTFFAFMKDEDYKRLLKDVKKICDDRGYDFVEKMTYQETGKTDFVVISYILFPMDTIMKCTYDMNTGEYKLEDTMYSEADIEDFELEQEIKEEEEAAQETLEVAPTVQPEIAPTELATVEPEPTSMPTPASQPDDSVPKETKKPSTASGKTKSKSQSRKKNNGKKPAVTKRPAAVHRREKTNQSTKKQEGSIGNGTATIQ